MLRLLSPVRLKLPFAQPGLRLCSSSAFPLEPTDLDIEAGPRKRRIRTPKSAAATPVTIAEDVRRHYCTPELSTILSTFPVKFLRKKFRYPEHFYIADPLAAEQIAPHLLADLPADRTLVEVNPGPGLLTEKLVRSERVRDLRLYETNREFMPALSERFVGEAAVANGCSLRAGDMLNLYRMAYQDKMDKGGRVQRFLEALPQRDWAADVNLRMFGCVGSVNFFKHLISSVVLQTDMMAFGRPEMLLVMPPPLYIHLTCDSRAGLQQYRSTSMLFQILFTHEFIGRVPRKYFLPFQFNKPLERFKRIEDLLAVDRDSLYLVRVVPRRDLFEIVAADQIQALWYFIKQNCVSRSRCVIPNLEKLIPGTGVHLILNQGGPPEPVRPLQPDCRPAADRPPASSNPSTTMSRNDQFEHMTIYTQFGELSPSQMLSLFHQFVGLPGYEGSAFKQGLQEVLQKMEISSAGIEDELAEVDASESAVREAEHNAVAEKKK